MTAGAKEDCAEPRVDDKQIGAGDHRHADDSTGDAECLTTGTPVRAHRRWTHRAIARWPLLVAGALLTAAAATTAGLYFGQYRGGEQINDAAAKSAIGAASDGTVALLSYSPDRLQSDLTAAKSHLTGEFLTYYGKFTDQIVAPAAKEKAVSTKAVIQRAAIADLHDDTARVLVFLDQTTTSKDAPEPVQTASSVKVSLSKVHGAWLISAFDPV